MSDQIGESKRITYPFPKQCLRADQAITIASWLPMSCADSQHKAVNPTHHKQKLNVHGDLLLAPEATALPACALSQQLSEIAPSFLVVLFLEVSKISLENIKGKERNRACP